MSHSIVHFAVYADDPERAMRFYEEVFGWTFTPWGPPGYWKIATGPGPGATEGALSQRRAPRGEGSPNAYRCTITVKDVDAVLSSIEAHGGTVRPPLAEIPQVGRVCEALDPEGNLFCVMEYVEGHPLAA